jgi:hypothetical protein
VSFLPAFSIFPQTISDLHTPLPAFAVSRTLKSKMDRRLDPHLQRIVDNATGMNNNRPKERHNTYITEWQHPVDWSFRTGLMQPTQEHAPFKELGKLPPTNCVVSSDNISTSDRVPFGVPPHINPPPFTSSNRVSLAPQNIYNLPYQDSRMLENSGNDFRFAQHLHEGAPMTRPPRPNIMQQSVISASQRSILFSQERSNSQPVDSIDHLANAMLTQKLAPSLQRELTPSNSFYRRQLRRINQLQPQKQQVTPPFNLSMPPAIFPCA